MEMKRKQQIGDIKRESNSKWAFRKKEKATFQAVLFLSHMEVLMVLKGDDDTQSHRVPANTNPAPKQTAPHNPLP